MSAEKLIIDVTALQTVEEGIRGHMATAKEDLEKVLQELQGIEADWSDDDMAALQESIAALQTKLDPLAESGKELVLRCQRKREALDRLHSMTI